MVQGAIFTSLYFLRNIQIGPISLTVILHMARLDCQGKNTLAYWTHLQVRKKLMCCEYGPRGRIQNTLFSL